MGSGMIRKIMANCICKKYMRVISKCSLLKIAHWSDRKIPAASKARKTLIFAFRVSPGH